MARNLDKRIELMFPVERVDHRARVMSVLWAMLRDTVKARWLRRDGTYERRLDSGEALFWVQQQLQDEARRRVTQARDRMGVVFKPEQRHETRRP